MKLTLVIAEYLRTLKERDELDRLIPDLLVEMGYVPIARPQTGNRQFGVDIAARGVNPETGKNELLLLVVKQKDIGRTEWNGGDQAVRPSLDEIFDTYLKSHIEAEDAGKPVSIAVVTNGDLKQTVQANWSGYVNDYANRASIKFWGVDTLAKMVEEYLLDEHVFQDEDRRDLRRALALSGDVEYDQKDLHRLMLKSLGLTDDGALNVVSKSKKELLKALRVVNFSARMFASWAMSDGDGRQALRAIERALLWSCHRVKAVDSWDTDKELIQSLLGIWHGCLVVGRQYFEKIQAHCYAEDSIFGYARESAELSLVAFEQIGFLASIGLPYALMVNGDDQIRADQYKNAEIVADALASFISNNRISNSPCFDRHSQDIALAMLLFVLTNRLDKAKEWLRILIRNIDYAFKAKKYVPIGNDSIDDLADLGGWHSGNTAEKLMSCSWMLPTLAGWCVALEIDDGYQVIRNGLLNDYPDTCAQLWHPDEKTHDHMYFHESHFSSGVSEAPIRLPTEPSIWRENMRAIVESVHGKECFETMGCKLGLPAIDLIANRHFGTPIAPAFWYQLVLIDSQTKTTETFLQPKLVD
jgi:hypothetical protein